jgi:hypothetical protein
MVGNTNAGSTSCTYVSHAHNIDMLNANMMPDNLH